MPVLGWIFIAWFAGMGVASVKTPYREKVHPKWGNTCESWCYYSGSFKNGVLRPMVPWPFRKGNMYKCPKEGDINDCTGKKYVGGKWVPFRKPAEWGSPSKWHYETMAEINKRNPIKKNRQWWQFWKEKNN